MSCWDKLGISPTDDKKAIKKAYAVLLKQNKPDENPEGFASLHAAYKESLYCASHGLVDNVDSVGATNTIASNENDHEDKSAEAYPEPTAHTVHDSATLESDQQVDDLVEQSDKNSEQVSQNETSESEGNGDDEEVDAELEAYFESLNVAWSHIVKETGAAISELVREDRVETWQFLDSYQEMYDFQFKHRYSYYLFEQLLELFAAESELTPKLRMKSLHFISTYFGWLDQQDSFEYEFGEDKCAPLFNVLLLPAHLVERPLLWTVPNVHTGPLEDVNYYARLGATFVDFFIIFVFVETLLPYFIHLNKADVMLHTFICYILVIPLLESSPMQGSVGKVLFGMKVSNRRGRRLGIVHAFFRQLIYMVNIAAFKIVVFINAFFIKDGRLLHDRMSFSRVVKRY